MKKIIIIAGILLFGLGSFARADIPSQTNSFYYVFHLYYDTGKLVVDRDFKFSYDVIPGDFIMDPIGQFPYRGEIINFAGEIAANFQFDPKLGKISVKAPYVADGQKAIFYDNQNQPVLTVPVSESSFCNDDGICNADRGEDSLSCPKDCSQSLATPLPTTTPVTPSAGSSGLLSSILYVLSGLILAGLAWWFFKHRREPTSLPTPPSPPNPGNTVQ